MKIKTITAFTSTLLIVVLVALAFDLFEILSIQKEAVHSEEARFESHELADQLRQSSDDLTRMAQTYVSTANPLYEQYYFDILDIRNGKQARPPDYSNTFWWRGNIQLEGGRAIPLQVLMHQAGFSDQEFALLAESQRRSDTLVNLEKEAFAAMKPQLVTAKGKTTISKPADPGYARSLLFSPQYNSQKALIMQPIDIFSKSVDARTSQVLSDLEQRQRRYLQLALFIVIIACLGLAIAWVYLNRAIHRPISNLLDRLTILTAGTSEKLSEVNAIATGNLERDVTPIQIPEFEPKAISRNEMGILLASIVRMGELQRSLDVAFRTMTISLRNSHDAELARDWLKTGLNDLNDVMRGEQETENMARKVLNYLAEYLKASVGVLYLYLFDTDTEDLNFIASYPEMEPVHVQKRFRLGEGLVGQVALEGKDIVLPETSTHHMPPAVASGGPTSRDVMAIPLAYAGNMVGVLELVPWRSFTELELHFIERIKEVVAIGFSVSHSRQRTQYLLTQTKQQSEALQRANDQMAQTLTQLREMQENLVEAEKLSALGSMVAGVSHELNTPLGNAKLAASTLRDHIVEIIGRYNQNVLTRTQLKEFLLEGQEIVDLANRAIERAIELISNFKQVAIDQTSEQRRNFDLAKVLEDTISTCRPSFQNEPWKINIDVPRNIEMDSYPGPLEQVILNLVLNSIRHGFEGREHGCISIGAYREPSTANKTDKIVITFSDDGVGIAPQNLGRVFDPFFTTKLGRGGSGIGLNITYRMVTTLLGGNIRVESKLGAGTTFILTIPCHAPDTVQGTNSILQS